jgi:hypothetical protein
MTQSAMLRPAAPAVPRAPWQRPLAVAALTMTTISIVVFAALSASGSRAIVAPIGPAGPFADLHRALAPQLVKGACWLAAATGGGGVMAGLAAARRGWRPRPGLLLAGGAVAAIVFAFVPPAASIDVQNYAEYGRIVVLGHNPWVMTPQQLYKLGDPVGLLRPTQWKNQPTVYGPAATALEAAAAWLGGAAMAWIAFWIKVMNGAAYIAVAVVIDRLAGPDPARRVRAALLWAVNPLMLFWMVAGAHTDLIAVLPLLLALLAARALRGRGGGIGAALGGLAPGILAGIAIAVKVTFAGPAAGLAAGLWQAAGGRRRTAVLASGVAGGTLVLAAGYAIAGRAALTSLTQRMSSANDSFLPLPAFVYHHTVLYAGVTLAAFLIIGGVLAWRMPPGYAGLPEIWPMLVCALAVVLGGVVQYPWYDAMFFPLLALLPSSRLDIWLLARNAALSVLLLPGIGITGHQYREVRIALPVFLACFLVATALGQLQAGGPGQPDASRG